MKRLISFVLTILLMFSLCVPAFAVVNADYSVPTITIRGDGSDIVTADEEPLWPKAIGDEEGDTEEIISAVAEVLLPYFPMGLISGNWDAYYDKFEEVMQGFFGDTALDGNGEPVSKGSKIGYLFELDNKYNMNRDNKKNGKYTYLAYQYHYDFRLSPYDHMEELDAYIQAVMKATKSDKVNLVGRCLGGGFLMCYLDYYNKKLEATGCEPYIKNVMFLAVTSNGCDALTSAFSGDMTFDAVALQRFLNEIVDPEDGNVDGILDTTYFIKDLILTSYDLFREVGVVDSVVIGTVDSLYKELYAGLAPRLLKALFGTWAGYWTAIDTEHFDKAVDLVFGEEGTESREEYAGLVSKIQKYNNEISMRKDEILDKCVENGIYFGNYVKYGYQAYPFVEEPNALSDSLVTVEKASFGATCGMVGTPLTDEYIAERTALGYGDYISKDKLIDLSTARFKDTTWVTKNIHHDNWEVDSDLVNNFLWSTNCTTSNDTSFARFTVLNDETGKKEPMTDENSGTSQWEDLESVEKSTIFTKLKAFFAWLVSMFKLLFNISK